MSRKKFVTLKSWAVEIFYKPLLVFGKHQGVRRQCLVLKDDISQKIPLGPAVAKYFGFTPQKLWESGCGLLNHKYLVTSRSANRYRLDGIGIPG